jgi:hypothetical protein
VGVFFDKDIYCEMKELIRHILYEHLYEQMEKKVRTESYTEDEIEQEARKYINQAEFAKGSPSHYQAFKKKKLQSNL